MAPTQTADEYFAIILKQEGSYVTFPLLDPAILKIEEGWPVLNARYPGAYILVKGQGEDPKQFADGVAAVVVDSINNTPFGNGFMCCAPPPTQAARLPLEKLADSLTPNYDVKVMPEQRNSRI